MKLFKYFKSFVKDFSIYARDKLFLKKNASILMYHSVGDNSEFFTVRPDDFDRQLAYLKNNNYNVVSLGDLVGLLKSDQTIPAKTIVLTFDDGYEDNYINVFPILKKYNFPATVFIVTGRMGDKGYTNKRGVALPMLSWDQIREMHGSGLIDFEPHTVTHPKLNRLTLSEAEEEMSRSKNEIEKELGKKCALFAYPQGRFNQDLAGLARGYFAGVVTIIPGFTGKSGDPYELPRNAVDSMVCDLRFKLKI